MTTGQGVETSMTSSPSSSIRMAKTMESKSASPLMVTKSKPLSSSVAMVTRKSRSAGKEAKKFVKNSAGLATVKR